MLNMKPTGFEMTSFIIFGFFKLEREVYFPSQMDCVEHTHGH